MTEDTSANTASPQPSASPIPPATPATTEQPSPSASEASSANAVSASTTSPPDASAASIHTVSPQPQTTPSTTQTYSVDASNASVPTVSPQPQASPIQPTAASTIAQPSPKTTLKYILIAVAAIAILGGGGFAAYKFFFNSDSGETAETNDAPTSINIDLPKDTSTDETATDTGKFEELQSVVSELKDIYTEQPPVDEPAEENPDNPPSLDFELSDETSTDSEATKTGVER